MKNFNISITFFYILLFVVSFLTMSCQEKDTFDLCIKLNKLEYRDSLAIVQVVKTWQDSSFEYFSNLTESPYYLEENQINIIILNGFYRFDKKKILTWFVRKVPNNNEEQSETGFIYYSNCIIGTRNDTNRIFNFLLFDQQRCEAPNIDWILKCMSQYFFQKMKEDITRIYSKYYNPHFGGKLRDPYDSNFDKSIYQQFGYNLQDKDFWDKSLIWYKGARIKGFENDELIEWARPIHLTNSDSSRIFKNYPKINYPDSILKLYPASYKELREGKKE